MKVGTYTVLRIIHVSLMVVELTARKLAKIANFVKMRKVPGFRIFGHIRSFQGGAHKLLP